MDKNDYKPDDLINKRFTWPNICEIIYTILSKVYDWDNDSLFSITVNVSTSVSPHPYVFDCGLHCDLNYTPAKFQDCISRNVGQGE